MTLIHLIHGCGDSAIVKLYDQNLTRHPPRCLALRVFPPDPTAKKRLQALYTFSKKCPYTLELSTKAGIHCNSGANAPLKTTSNFPSAYLRLELREGMRLLYSYYIDLTNVPGAGDVERAWKRFSKDIPIGRRSR